MIKTTIHLFFLVVILGITNNSHAATCSCATVPLLGSMEASSPDSGSWYFSASYESHDISDLVSGSEDVTDETNRERHSRSLILEASRGINDSWSVASLLSIVEHERRVGNNPTETSDGIGDAIFLVKYSPSTISTLSRYAYAFGVGLRVPVGEDDAKSRLGIALAEDMQPSTGALGTMLWAYTAHSLDQAAKKLIYLSASYTANEENRRDYRFGDEATLTLGGSYQISQKWGINLGLKYRNTERDERRKSSIPNTGGKWLDLSPTIQYHLTPSFAGKLSYKLPVWRDLNDELQFTTSSSWNLSFSYVL